MHEPYQTLSEQGAPDLPTIREGQVLMRDNMQGYAPSLDDSDRIVIQGTAPPNEQKAEDTIELVRTVESEKGQDDEIPAFTTSRKSKKGKKKGRKEEPQIWEDETLQFFEVVVPQAQARQLVANYTTAAEYGFPSNAEDITSDVTYHGLSLDGNNNQPVIKVMNTDDCFRHLLLNTTNQTQLSGFVNQTANNIRQPFPVGLSTPVGLLVANPAFGGDPVYAANWTNNAYHGTVVWSWQMAMMAAGLQRQLERCNTNAAPDFCSDSVVRPNVLAAYNHLWDLIEANTPQLSSEVWSWQYVNGEFAFVSLGALPPPPGSSPTESDVRQLWSLTFLAVRRDTSLR